MVAEEGAGGKVETDGRVEGEEDEGGNADQEWHHRLQRSFPMLLAEID